jgi:hypothetical protein
MIARAEGPAVKSVASGLERSPAPLPERSEWHERLGVFIGKWINEGATVAGDGMDSVPIVTSDVYEWAPGGFFVIHSAYGRIGGIDVGAIEMIGVAPGGGAYRSRLFDSMGNESVSLLTLDNGIWHWRGERSRCAATFRADGRVQMAHHERSPDGHTWEASMDVVLTKVW